MRLNSLIVKFLGSGKLEIRLALFDEVYLFGEYQIGLDRLLLLKYLITPKHLCMIKCEIKFVRVLLN